VGHTLISSNKIVSVWKSVEERVLLAFLLGVLLKKDVFSLNSIVTLNIVDCTSSFIFKLEILHLYVWSLDDIYYFVYQPTKNKIKDLF